jgi:GTP-binding protein
MIIRKAVFVISNRDYLKCPKADRPEYAFIGRSNVGKSSLINMLVSNSSLAKTSGKPGKTQLINHFSINDSWYLVDLPGYGFAKVSRDTREQWDNMIKNYLKNRENLQCVFILVDSRLDPQVSDLELMEWMAISGIPFVLIFTKVDKQSKSKTLGLIARYKKELEEQWEEFPIYFVSSAETGQGREEILKFIEDLNVQYKQKKEE